MIARLLDVLTHMLEDRERWADRMIERDLEASGVRGSEAPSAG